MFIESLFEAIGSLLMFFFTMLVVISYMINLIVGKLVIEANKLLTLTYIATKNYFETFKTPKTFP
jgi:hypothetical protein